MKQFLIRYRRGNGTEAQWHQDIQQFIAAVEGDPELAGKISYRCMKVKDSTDYLHIATAADDAAVKMLQGREFFKRYNEQTRLVAIGDVQVSPLEIVAQTRAAP
jgi:hypothetical protein